MKARKAVERAIQRALVHYLKTTLSPFSLRVCAPLNENSRHELDMGVDVGCPDLILGRRVAGRYYTLYLELKVKDGDMHKSQIEWNSDFDANHACFNCQRAVGYGYKDAIRYIELWLSSHDPNAKAMLEVTTAPGV